MSNRKKVSFLILFFNILLILLGGFYLTDLRKKNHEQNKELKEQIRRAEMIVISSPVALIMCGEKGIITVVSPITEYIFGYPGGGLVGKEIHQLLPPDLRSHHKKVFEKTYEEAMNSPDEKFVYYRKQIPSFGYTRNKKIFPCYVSIRVIRYGERIEFITLIEKRQGIFPEKQPGKLILPKDEKGIPKIKESLNGNHSFQLEKFNRQIQPIGG